MEYVSTNNAPGAIGPYSQAVKTGNLLFTSGQIAINPATGNVEATTIEAQTRQVCENLKAVVEAAGTSLDKAVKTVCFLIISIPFGIRDLLSFSSAVIFSSVVSNCRVALGMISPSASLTTSKNLT